jgi:hypothetical protein
LKACFEKCRDFNGESLCHPPQHQQQGTGKFQTSWFYICGAEFKTKDMV